MGDMDMEERLDECIKLLLAIWDEVDLGQELAERTYDVLRGNGHDVLVEDV